MMPRVLVEVAQPHGEAAGVDRVKLHEAGPGFVEQDVIAERPDAREDFLRAVDRAVIGALLDNGGAERPLALPSVFVGDERSVVDGLADFGRVE